MNIVQITQVDDIPAMPDTGTKYFFPRDPTIPSSFTDERRNRNIGWMREATMRALSKKIIGVAGGGGIGSPAWDALIRFYFEQVRFADNGVFDISNIHRQLGATAATVSKSKLLETIRYLLSIVHDMDIWGYIGITYETVEDFLTGLDLAIDSIEYQAIGARHLLNLGAREKGIPVMNGNSVGYGTNLFYFDPNGPWLGDVWPHDLAYSYELEEKSADPAHTREWKYLCTCINSVFLNPLYNYGGMQNDTSEAFLDRLIHKRTASIVSTNPRMAAGFMLDRMLICLSEEFDEYPQALRQPRFPDYLHFDAATFTAEIRTLDIKATRHALVQCMPS